MVGAWPVDHAPTVSLLTLPVTHVPARHPHTASKRETDPSLVEVGVRYACVMDSVRRWHRHRH